MPIVWQASMDSLKTHFVTISVTSSAGFDHKLLENFNERPDDVLMRFDNNHF
jgi:hypothetical protein